MRVNELAERLNVTADTVRYYTRIGLLVPLKDFDNGYKNYTKADEKRLTFILKSRNLGFSISEIQTITDMAKTGTSPCCKVREIVFQHLDETSKKIQELQKLQKHMKQATHAWEAMPDSMPDGDSVCDLIESWDTIELCEPV